MTLASNPGRIALLRSCSIAAGAVVTLVGALVMVGWAFGITNLKSIEPGWVTMKANAAVAVALGGTSLLVSRLGAPRGVLRLGASACAVGMVLVGLLTVAEYVSGRDFLIDQILFREPAGAAGTTHLGRMAPTTALCLILLGTALLLVDREGRHGRRPAEHFALGTTFVALLALVGYLYGVPSLYGPTAYTQMALPTAASLAVLAAGILCAHPDRGWMAVLSSDSAGGHLLRRLLPAALGVPLVLGWLRLAGQRAGLYLTEPGVSLLIVGSIVAFTVLVSWNARSLHRTDLERLRAEGAVRDAKEAAEAANGELEAFSYSVSHDLRAPLRAIDGFSQALIEDFSERLDSRGKDYLGRVRSGTQRMGRLIDDLLELSHVTRTELRRTAVDLSSLAYDIVLQMQRLQPDREVDLVIEEGMLAFGDAPLLRVVLENLLGNAWKFTGHRPRAKIELGVTSRNGQAVYFVRDDGAGFDMGLAGKLFAPFQRLHRASEFEGTGVGLATAQRIVRRHGGRVWAEGRVDQGATFYFTLPTTAPEETHD